jgi:hypothetical protein
MPNQNVCRYDIAILDFGVWKNAYDVATEMVRSLCAVNPELM